MKKSDIPHIPVLLNEMLEYLSPQEGQLYVDATFGAGGYSKAILKSANCHLIGIDRDHEVQPFVHEMQQAFPERFQFIEGQFSELERLLNQHNIQGVDGIILDIGVSSMQLDTALRGFSFQQNGPLDMRMGGQGITAQEVVNHSSEKELADIIYAYGDEHKSRAIARQIVLHRAEKPIETTGELANIVRKVFKGGYYPIDPATKTFQAIRIYINEELDELTKVLHAAERVLRPNGRLIIVCFHSLEDRIVKQFLLARSQKLPGQSRHVPDQSHERPAPSFMLAKSGVIKPSEEEVKRNPRARSARMRCAFRTDAPAHENYEISRR